ncbi:MAG: ATP-binding protein [Dehalococcoidales bacterium]|nr:ATP-binding protein [Dehalococcoidales bacterium]
MSNYITSADVNILNGLFFKSIQFENGLNIISGENGTCKTTLLKELKESRNIKIKAFETANQIKIIAYSPKRNSERKKIENIFAEMRRDNKMLTKYIDEKASTNFQDNTFVAYASLAELYFLAFDELRKDGLAQIDKMKELSKEFNKIIKMIFENYELVSEWDTKTGYPEISISKEGIKIQIDGLSLGEQEILSLVFNLYTSRNRNDVFLIDEPEIHLNWHLEEALFNFFDWFCTEFKKQVIIATHSRVIFKKPFLNKTQFLFWKDGHIDISKEIPAELRRRISGEGIEIIKLGEFTKPTFFVEDQAHEDIIQVIAEILGNSISVSQCGNSQNVISLFRHSLREGNWSHCYFVIDGDNL